MQDTSGGLADVTSPFDETSDLTLAILAGGQGRRMGGAKGFIRIAGRPILIHLLEQLAWQGPTVLVTAPGREHPPGWQAFGQEVHDPVSEAGPLRGLLTALEHLPTSELVVTTVDMPMVHRESLLWLARELAARPACCGVMTRRTFSDGETLIAPFPSAYRAGARQIIANRLARERRSVYRILEDPRFGLLSAPADWAASELWTNLNTPADLQRLPSASWWPES